MSKQPHHTPSPHKQKGEPSTCELGLVSVNAWSVDSLIHPSALLNVMLCEQLAHVSWLLGKDEFVHLRHHLDGQDVQAYEQVQKENVLAHALYACVWACA